MSSEDSRNSPKLVAGALVSFTWKKTGDFVQGTVRSYSGEDDSFDIYNVSIIRVTMGFVCAKGTCKFLFNEIKGLCVIETSSINPSSIEQEGIGSIVYKGLDLEHNTGLCTCDPRLKRVSGMDCVQKILLTTKDNERLEGSLHEYTSCLKHDNQVLTIARYTYYRPVNSTNIKTVQLVSDFKAVIGHFVSVLKKDDVRFEGILLQISASDLWLSKAIKVNDKDGTALQQFDLHIEVQVHCSDIEDIELIFLKNPGVDKRPDRAAAFTPHSTFPHIL